ncbi:MAG: shikimate kinase [Bacteroidales bacterium]|nr:shikimate kinase [Bacteroidales bacterium]MCL2737817.1 shikimate kinase [Bacteroidales bacterium]
MLVFLIGFMGSGKTTLGRALAAQLNGHFVDLDREIEDYSGCSVSELFKRTEEPGFRKVEQQVLHNTVRRLQDPSQVMQDGVIACGGGTPCFRHNLSFMKANGFVIYLEVSPEILCERLLLCPERIRPMIPTRNPEQLLIFIRDLLGRRRPIYEAAHWKC